MNKKLEINKNTNIGELISKHPETIEVFLKHQMHCACCPASSMDTIEQGATLHGMSDEKIENLIDELKAVLK